MVVNCKSYPKLKDCWKEIGEALPYRPYVAVYSGLIYCLNEVGPASGPQKRLSMS